MGGLQRFEQRLENLISGAFARAFRSAVQPVEIAAALQRECDNNAQILSRERRMVPNDFHVELSQVDLDRLAPYDTALADELTHQVQDHADAQGYVFPGPIAIEFEKADDLTTGRFRIRSKAQARVQSNATHTQVRRARAVLEINRTRHPLQPPGLVVGRGTEADVRINDPGVSRRHIEFDVRTDVRQGKDDLKIEVRDLGSTNGMLIDGHKVTKAGVRDGSQVRIGNTTMTVRILEDDEDDRLSVAWVEPVSELTLFLIRIAYLAILWIFVLSAISVIRSDMFGARVPEAARGADAARKEKRGAKKQPPKRRGSPTHVDRDRGQQRRRARRPRPTRRSSSAAAATRRIKLDDDYVSTRHARIAASGDQWFVEDLGSTNGTYIGTVRITQPTTITLGTQVRIGKTILELRK